MLCYTPALHHPGNARARIGVGLFALTDANLILVFLVYGVALFTVGLSTALEAQRKSEQSALGANLWALS
ncbi:MAG: hypothetical protein ACYC7H_10080, partial [Chloroflexota bacterium]